VPRAVGRPSEVEPEPVGCRGAVVALEPPEIDPLLPWTEDEPDPLCEEDTPPHAAATTVIPTSVMTSRLRAISSASRSPACATGETRHLHRW
jgi:hypothetical protein